MKDLLRQGSWLALAAWISWWFVLRPPLASELPRAEPVRSPALELTPLPVLVENPAPAAAAELAARAPEKPHDAPAPLATAEERLVLPDKPAIERVASVDPSAASAIPAPPVRELGEAANEEAAAGIPAPPPPVHEAPIEHEVSAIPAASASAAAVPVPGETEMEAPAREAEMAAAPADEPSPADSEPRASAGDRAKEEDAADPRAPRTAPPALQSAAEEVPGPTAHEPLPLARPPAGRSVESLMRDPTLLTEAREEFERGETSGFKTVLLALPEEQVEIARFFGEELVLVPRRAIVPEIDDPSYFRLAATGESRVEAISGAPPLAHHRQYRDLFDYEYGRLPAALRELRRSVLARGEIYLFAALLSPQEWALVIARRRAALALAGRELADVRRFVLRYLHPPGGGLDLAVDEIVFADGSHFRPDLHGRGD